MRTLRWGTALLLAGLAATLAAGCGDTSRSEEILGCALPCNSDGDCFVGQKCVVNDSGQGCCDRYFDRALVNTDDDSLTGRVVSTEINALNRRGESDVDGSWTRSEDPIFFYDGAAGYRDADSPIGDAFVILVNSRLTTDAGDRELLKVYLPFGLFDAGATISLDDEHGMAEYYHNQYATSENGNITTLQSSELLGVSYAYGEDLGEVVVDTTTASTTVGEDFTVDLSVYLTVP